MYRCDGLGVIAQVRLLNARLAAAAAAVAELQEVASEAAAAAADNLSLGSALAGARAELAQRDQRASALTEQACQGYTYSSLVWPQSS